MTVDIKGLKELERNITRLKKLYSDDLVNVVNAGGLKVQNDAKRSISTGARSGKIYARGNGRVHQASARGEAPKTDHGTLVAHIAIEPGGDLGGPHCDVGTNLRYGRDLELKMDRAWLFPALERNRTKINAAIQSVVANRTKKGPR